MRDEKTYHGACFCGDVQLTVSGEPEAMGYCHCEDCRHWSAGPVNAFTLWKPDAVEVVQGTDKLGIYQKTPASLRKWCRSCGGHVLTEHPELGLVDVYAAIIPDLSFKPALHVHYQDAVLRIADGLTKMRDVPAEMGGTGETLDE
ncbi:GFA family protein [Halomonas sp. TRM85114]|uniref:GFA family protein n=1 Tax=Halomonas jincaotanensis TaxID=2810616 RepID=UPI001BD5808E|nr:GFA family protein [Halomonas jincaotanensis]MBS9402219.1 GFA family protein [Halomonas jincaotanensis]